ncbi:MAG TPA: class I SAM-dependent methyltransferase [Thermoanaerobaculia bacterium]|nr:class I SAM-dependent methyltransferase [Thermoanaerobaculia bacterium]
MPDLDWNRKWGAMIAGFAPEESEAHFGDRWGDPETFGPLLEVRQRFLDPYFDASQTVIEIGSGGGRWTQYLARAARLIVVEYNAEAFAYLARRFPSANLTTYRTQGFEMHGIPAGSADFVFTFDVFVHLEPEGIGAYLHEIERVLRPGGTAVVHYGDVRKDIAQRNPGFSRMTRERMEERIAATGLQVLDHDELIMFHSNLVALRRA